MKSLVGDINTSGRIEYSKIDGSTIPKSNIINNTKVLVVDDIRSLSLELIFFLVLPELIMESRIRLIQFKNIHSLNVKYLILLFINFILLNHSFFSRLDLFR